MNPIRSKMRPAFARLDGGLFSEVQKADVGDMAEQMKRQGVAMMSWADPFMPDPATPECVLEAARDALESGCMTHYTMPIGDMELKRLIATRIERKYGLKPNPERNLIINPGSDTGLMFAMFPWIGPGDEVLVPDPSYPSNFLNPELLGGVTVRVPTYPEDGYHLRMEEFERRVTEKTKMLLLTNPNNPTCVSYTRVEMEQLAAFCCAHDLVCVCDQAFEDTVFPGHEMVCMAALPGMWERTVTVCSVSKGMGLSGFRVGWLMADDAIMDVYYASAVNVQGAPSTIAQMAVKPAFRDDSFIGAYLEKYDRRRKYAHALFNAVPGVSMQMPEAGFFLWIDVSALGDSTEITSYLVREARVSVNDGKFYGTQGAGHLRLISGAFWEDRDAFEAMERMAEALRQYPKEK